MGLLYIVARLTWEPVFDLDATFTTTIAELKGKGGRKK